MDDRSPLILLLAEVRAALEKGLSTGFEQKVAANALGIIQRELERGPAIDTDEAARLTAAVREGAAGHAVIGELIALATAQIEIDQPSYPGFHHWRQGL